MSNIKCCDCQKKLKKEDVQIFAKRNYCSVCYDKAQLEEKERKHLIGVICDIFNISRPTGMMFAQIKQFQEEGLNYTDIRLTLQYLVHVEKFQLEQKYGVGIVRHRYKDMKHYYDKMLRKRREVEEVDYKPSNYKIFIKERENELVKKNMIDLNKIVRGDDDE